MELSGFRVPIAKRSVFFLEFPRPIAKRSVFFRVSETDRDCDLGEAEVGGVEALIFELFSDLVHLGLDLRRQCLRAFLVRLPFSGALALPLVRGRL